MKSRKSHGSRHAWVVGACYFHHFGGQHSAYRSGLLTCVGRKYLTWVTLTPSGLVKQQELKADCREAAIMEPGEALPYWSKLAKRIGASRGAIRAIRSAKQQEEVHV